MMAAWYSRNDNASQDKLSIPGINIKDTEADPVVNITALDEIKVTKLNDDDKKLNRKQYHKDRYL